MTRWEYALLSNPASGEDGIRFSHQQHAGIVQEFSQALGRGLKAERSNQVWLHVNLGHTTTAMICGLLGERGWELVSHSTLTGGHEYYSFKRARE